MDGEITPVTALPGVTVAGADDTTDNSLAQADRALGAGPTSHAVRAAARNSHGLEQLVRPLLGALAEIGHFDSTYLTTIDWAQRHQEVRYAHNINGVEVPEGHHIDCPPDLTEQTFLGVTRSNDLPTPHPDSHVARGLGLGTYVSVPVVTIDHRLFGTLCGASRASRDVADGTVSVMEFFARLIADHLTRADVERNARRAAVAEVQLRDRAIFLAEAEHMLKTPLAIIAGFVATLRQQGPSLSVHDTAAALEVIERNTELLTEQINRLLEERLAESIARDLHPEPIDVGEAIGILTTAFAAASGGREVRIDKAGAAWAEVDPAALDQVLGHLLDNATKYSPSGTPLVVRVRRDGSWIEIDISDEGIGIPPDIDVFGAFQRGADDVVRAAPGAGLGLHIVRTLTEAMGGEVTARRNQDRGSTFTLHLPAAQPPA